MEALGCLLKNVSEGGFILGFNVGGRKNSLEKSKLIRGVRKRVLLYGGDSL